MALHENKKDTLMRLFPIFQLVGLYLCVYVRVCVKSFPTILESFNFKITRKNKWPLDSLSKKINLNVLQLVRKFAKKIQ